jgi:RAB6A-GEF complex partner protein 1
VVQCTRKTEARSWRTLFTYLPPPAELFEEALQRGSLKTAGGYLLVLHTFEELSSSSDQLIRLLARAKDEGDWGLCKELARFLAALDETGDALREALKMVDLRSPFEPGVSSSLFDNSRLKVSEAMSNGIANTSGGPKYGHGRSNSGSGSPTRNE